MSLVPSIPTYYRQATRLPMPVSRFQAGKTYEICVQAIDPWYASSPFSKVIEFTPQAECHITLPAKAGVDEYVPYRTVSNVQGSLSIRQAEGMDLSKAGYQVEHTRREDCGDHQHQLDDKEHHANPDSG